MYIFLFQKLCFSCTPSLYKHTNISTFSLCLPTYIVNNVYIVISFVLCYVYSTTWKISKWRLLQQFNTIQWRVWKATTIILPLYSYNDMTTVSLIISRLLLVQMYSAFLYSTNREFFSWNSIVFIFSCGEIYFSFTIYLTFPVYYSYYIMFWICCLLKTFFLKLNN